MWKNFDSKKGLKISKEIIERRSDKAIIFFPFWTGNPDIYKNLAKKFPEYTLVFYDYPNEVLSEDVKLSIGYINEIIKDAENLIISLRKKRYKEIILIGSSFGSNIALKLSTKVNVDKIVLNMVDSDLAKVIFKSPALIILKKKLQKKGFTLKKLDKIYSFISAKNTILKIKNKKDLKILLFLSRNDIFCNIEESKPLIKKLNKSNINYKLKRNFIFGHILGIYKNLIFNKNIVNFIKN